MTLVLCASVSAKKWLPLFEKYPYMGMVLCPSNWRTPYCQHYICDNDAFANRNTPDWWETKGEAAWFRMLPKIPPEKPPLFVLLPDVVADWKATVERASLYGSLIRQAGFRTGIALQDGCDFEEALNMETDAVFIGGSTEWKRSNIASITKFFQAAGKWVHVGRINPGSKTARLLDYCLWCGVDSVDGTGYNKFSDAILPLMSRSVNFWREDKDE